MSKNTKTTRNGIDGRLCKKLIKCGFDKESILKADEFIRNGQTQLSFIEKMIDVFTEINMKHRRLINA